MGENPATNSLLFERLCPLVIIVIPEKNDFYPRPTDEFKSYEVKTNGDDPFSPVFVDEPLVTANACKQKLGNAMGDRFEFSLSRKETSTFFLSLSPSLSLSLS